MVLEFTEAITVGTRCTLVPDGIRWCCGNSRGQRQPRQTSLLAGQVIVSVVVGDNAATEIVWRAISVTSAGPLPFPRCGSGIVRIRTLGLNKTRLDVRPHNA